MSLFGWVVCSRELRLWVWVSAKLSVGLRTHSGNFGDEKRGRGLPRVRDRAPHQRSSHQVQPQLLGVLLQERARQSPMPSPSQRAGAPVWLQQGIYSRCAKLNTQVQT